MKRVQLTEKQLNRVIMESARRIIKEDENEERALSLINNAIETSNDASIRGINPHAIENLKEQLVNIQNIIDITRLDPNDVVKLCMYIDQQRQAGFQAFSNPQPNDRLTTAHDVPWATLPSRGGSNINSTRPNGQGRVGGGNRPGLPRR